MPIGSRACPQQLALSSSEALAHLLWMPSVVVALHRAMILDGDDHGSHMPPKEAPHLDEKAKH